MNPAISLFHSISDQDGTGKSEISRFSRFVSAAKTNAETSIARISYLAAEVFISDTRWRQK